MSTAPMTPLCAGTFCECKGLPNGAQVISLDVTPEIRPPRLQPPPILRRTGRLAPDAESPLPVRHIFFDDNNAEIPWKICMPLPRHVLEATHPLVLLSFFEFVDVYNSHAIPDLRWKIPPIPRELMDRIYRHSFWSTHTATHEKLIHYLEMCGTSFQ
jgi:hypothetical protein